MRDDEGARECIVGGSCGPASRQLAGLEEPCPAPQCGWAVLSAVKTGSSPDHQANWNDDVQLHDLKTQRLQGGQLARSVCIIPHLLSELVASQRHYTHLTAFYLITLILSRLP